MYLEDKERGNVKMKVKNANVVREYWTKKFIEFLEKEGEDVGQIASNSINYPIEENGEEGWIELKIIVPKHDEGYEKREEYQWKLEEDKRKEKEAEEKKAKKIERDKKRREEMKAKREAERKKKEEEEEE